jgi:hypothetical protein
MYLEFSIKMLLLSRVLNLLICYGSGLKVH